MNNFNSNTTRYDQKNALLLAQAAEAAYLDGEAACTAFQGLGAQQVELFDRRETQAVVASSAEAIIIAFRGTEFKIKDWMTDLDVDLVDSPVGRVHDGFNRALGFVWAEMEAYILKLRADNRANGKQPRSIWFTGHSLGAALATLAVARYKVAADHPVHGLYTYGCPRVGDQSFARNFDLAFKSQAFRFVNNNDVVTRVPLRAMGYRHVGTFHYITEDGRIETDIHWWNLFLDRISGRIDDFLKPGTDGMKDHGIGNYVTAIGDFQP